jgi:hypothetical protein
MRDIAKRNVLEGAKDRIPVGTDDILSQLKERRTEGFDSFYQFVEELHLDLPILEYQRILPMIAKVLADHNREEARQEREQRESEESAIVPEDNRTLAEQIFHKRQAPAFYSGMAPSRQAIEGAKRFIRQFVKQLRFTGHETEGGYFEVIGDPIISKISLCPVKGGAFYRHRDEKRFRDIIPGSNPVMLWIWHFHPDQVDMNEEGNLFCRSTQIFKNAVRDILEWCEQMENGYVEPEHESNDEKLNRYALILGSHLDESLSGSGNSIREKFIESIIEYGWTQEEVLREFPELFDGPVFRKILRHWIKYPNDHFEVTEDPKIKNNPFTLRKINSDNSTPVVEEEQAPVITKVIPKVVSQVTEGSLLKRLRAGTTHLKTEPVSLLERVRNINSGN